MIVSRAAERDGHTICAETASIAITRNTAIRTIQLEAKEAFFTEETADAEEGEGTEEALFFVEKEDAEGAKEADAAHAETHSARALIPMTSSGSVTSGSMVIIRCSSRYHGALMIFGNAPTSVTVHTYTSATSRNATVNAITSRRRSLRRSRDDSDDADAASVALECDAGGGQETETGESAAETAISEVEASTSTSAEATGTTVEAADENESEARAAARREAQTKAAAVPAISNSANRIAGKPSSPSVRQNEIDSHKFLDG